MVGSMEFGDLYFENLGTSAPTACPIDVKIDSCDLLSPDQVSLLSTHSAPPVDSNMLSLGSARRDVILDVHPHLPEVSSLPMYMSPHSEVEEDSLLTLSSLTGRPLLDASKKLRRSKQIKKTSARKQSIQPLDGGYGWIIVLGAFIVQFCVSGLFKSYGVLYVEIMETFPESSAAVASWIPAVLSTLCLALAPVSSALCEIYSCRCVVFIGGLFCACGLALSYYATSLQHLLMTFGVLTGVGGGLSTTPGIVMVSQYFDKHRALANGICVSGTAAGSFVFPMLIDSLVGRYGFHGTVLLLGGGMLHVCVSATLYRDPADVCDSTVIDDYPENSDRVDLKNNVIDEMKVHPDELESESLMNKENGLMNVLNKTNNDYYHKGTSYLTDIFHPSIIELTRPKLLIQSCGDSENSEEDLDVIGLPGEQHLRLRNHLRATLSSSILHSVEDLSTDSMCVYKANSRCRTRSLVLSPQADFRRDLTANLLVDKVKTAEHNEEVKVKYETDTGCKLSRYLDVSMLRSFPFLLMCCSVTLMSCGSPYALYYVPAHAVHIGYDKTDAGRLVAISAILDMTGRLGLGWVCDSNIIDRKKAYFFSILIAGICVILFPTLRLFWLMGFATGVYGLCLGCWFLLVPVLLADTFGTKKMSSSYGLIRFFQSIAAISVPPLTGLIRDVSGGYNYCFYAMGTAMVLGSIPVLIFISFEDETDKSDGESETA